MMNDTGGEKVICEGCKFTDECKKIEYWKNVSEEYARYIVRVSGQCVCKELK